MPGDIGTGTTLTIAGGPTYELISVQWNGASRESIDISHMGTTGGRDFIPSDLYDPGEIVAEVNLDSANGPQDVFAASTTNTITFPDAGTWAANGFITNVDSSIPLDDKMTQTITIKLTGGIT